ncbi:DNA polymerase [Roseiarcus fermentans]|uniref:Type-4 uracil-DNA glycosylase n=1 Tax=Roseiarcus fermentans TaxID=1473586 RepID=A0A366FQN3_9HYPH|nr:uracil-DNA glycosylase [Roseiarcus fermentans]RBP16456.1 DNA polymerase [Roseiarcus fermentans]
MGPQDGRLTPEDAAEALLWWAEAGVGFTVGAAPRDCFALPAEAPRRAEPQRFRARPEESRAETPVARPPGLVGAPAALAAAEIAASARDLDDLRAALERFDGCALRKTATQLVFSDGVPGARVMLVGEGPGGDEDRIGRPFVGRAGQLLDRMLAAIGLDRSRVYIANVVPWRPPGNRTPTPEETQACLPFIKRQIELADPEILVCLGALSAQTLLGVKAGITRARGSWFAYQRQDGRTLRALAMLHPAYLLRSPSQKRAAWADMRALAAALDGAARPEP